MDPRHDFYQTPAHLILSLYVKGYSAPELVDQVKVAFCTSSVGHCTPRVRLKSTDGPGRGGATITGGRRRDHATNRSRTVE